MESQQSEPAVETKDKVLSVFIDDFTDPDNQAAALLWAKFLAKQRLPGIFIAEPRPVKLGEYLPGKDFGQCSALLKELKVDAKEEMGDVSEKGPLTIMLAGRMTEDIISKLATKTDGRSLSDHELNLLRKCVPLEPEDYLETDDVTNKQRTGRTVIEDDAITHAQLLVMDYLSTMNDQGAKFDTYIDYSCISALERPINLKLHHHEELVFRTAGELEDYRKVIEGDEDIKAKAEKLRKWYQAAIVRKLKEFNNIKPWEELKKYTEPWEALNEYGSLFGKMDKYDKIDIFGGCSLTLLAELLKHEGLSKKVSYYQQGGTFTPALNILGNPLNFALNNAAAQWVCNAEQAKKLKKFTLIPTDTTKFAAFTVKGLVQWSAPVGLHALVFYGKVEPWDLITDKERAPENSSASTKDIIRWRSEQMLEDDKYNDPSAYKAVIADLVAFLAVFTNAFDGYHTPDGPLIPQEVGVEVVTDAKKGMLLRKLKSSPIKALIFESPPAKSGKEMFVTDTADLIKRGIGENVPTSK